MKQAKLPIAILALTIVCTANATTLEQYIKVCVDNPRNGMGPELCECMGTEAINRFSEEEFGFFYASAAKDAAATTKYNMALGPQQKMNVIMFSMKGPSECANKLSRQGKKPSMTNQGGAASGASSAAEDSSR